MTMIEKVGLAIARKLGEDEFYISKSAADELGRVAIEAMRDVCDFDDLYTRYGYEYKQMIDALLKMETPAPNDAGESRGVDG